MTTKPDLDQALASWLRDVPPHSDRARLAVFAQLGTTRQHRPRPSWLYGSRSTSPGAAPGRSRSGVSAMRPMALVALIALGTGAVYLAVGQGPSPVPTIAPSATASPTIAPSTRPLTGLLARVVTEEVEPGVLRVVSDGYRDLSMDLLPDPTPARLPFRRSNVVAGPDGSVWLFGADEWYRVGQAATYPVTDETPNLPSMAQVAPDGTLWTLVGPDDESSSTLVSFEDGSWTVRKESVDAFDLELDGTVWVTSGGRFVRLRDGWQTDQLSDAGAFWVSPVTPVRKADGDEIEVVAYVAGPDGSLDRVWLQEDSDTHGGPAGDLPVEIDAVDMDLHGDLWVYQHLDIPVAGTGTVGDYPSTHTTHYLVHVTGESPTVYTDEEGVPELGGIADLGPVLRAAPDGSVWLTPRDESGGCRGLANFDGTTWTRYLPGRCVFALDITPDGTVWLQAAAQGVTKIPEEPEKSEKAETLVIPG